MQRELQIRGYETGARDGVAGVMTRAAIMAYEHDHGLALTARPSQQLLKAIVLGEAGKGKGVKAETAEAQDVIRSVQRSLAKLRYKPGPANGRMTPETARAIRAFEGDQALRRDGSRLRPADLAPRPPVGRRPPRQGTLTLPAPPPPLEWRHATARGILGEGLYPPVCR